MVELQAGQVYRLEIGSGGIGSSSASTGWFAQNGQATRFLQRTDDLDWRVLAEAGAGFGAGSYNAKFQYSPGGQGGFSSPHPSHLETHLGSPGSPSRSDLRGPAEILSPERLLGSSALACDAGDPSSCEDSGKPNLPQCCKGGSCYGGMQRFISGLSVTELCIRAGVRQPCGDTPGAPRVACSDSSPIDWFLTCSSSFRLGSNDMRSSYCYGFVNEANRSQPDLYYSHTDPFTRSNSISSGPLGGNAVVGQGAAASRNAGEGGRGSCPVMWLPSESTRQAIVEGLAGQSGRPGMATLSRCRRRGAYILALQRCRGAEPEVSEVSSAHRDELGWTLHGLWPEGAQNCKGAEFDLGQLSDLRARLEVHWPSCRGSQVSEQFWRWEWLKHGACFGTDQHRYFKLAMDLLEQHSAACDGWTSEECRLCITADFKLCKGLPQVPH
mmetsp:Transcript_64465/g.140349  ORF Transcript_64465/g.140349 Transcript_64465/m.140349 type:complete len:440 (+) Transcript_64465:2-1321(+)